MEEAVGVPDKPWRVQFICCDKDTWTADYSTWEEADSVRQEYMNTLDGHEKTAVLKRFHMDFPVITICGSMRFYKQMRDVAEMLTLQRWIVLMPFVTVAAEAQNSNGKFVLDAMHFAKIDKSEAIYVVNPDGYIGESTRLEINYAREQGKRVMFSVCPKCKGRGYVPDFSQGLDSYYGEPRKALCLACQVMPDV